MSKIDGHPSLLYVDFLEPALEVKEDLTCRARWGKLLPPFRLCRPEVGYRI